MAVNNGKNNHNNNETSNLLKPRSQAWESQEYGTNGFDNAPKAATTDHGKSNHIHPWLIPFFINIFLACASFSIVMPSLAPYLHQIGAPLSFLPWVVSSYSIGEMIGSAAIGSFYEYATKTFHVEGRGPRVSLLMSHAFGVLGSAVYSLAGLMDDGTTAQYCILLGRFVQGIWTGGQQAVEQAYLSAAVQPSTRVEYTATLSTCSVLGFVMGPSIGALFCQIDTKVYGASLNANNAPGVFILVAVSIMFLQTAMFFDGKDDRTGGSPTEDETNERAIDSQREESDRNKKPFNRTGVGMSILVFLVHYYSFAVQETITTPMVVRLYEWTPVEINLLFVGAGIISLFTSFSVRYITRYVDDQNMLISSIVIGLVGSIFLIDLPFETVLPVWRFLLGFSLITMAFPVGRNIVLGVFGNILGPVNQGRWMGAIIAVSAVPRALGPFLAMEALDSVNWRTWLEFGICAALFLVALIGTIQTIDYLVPYSKFVDGRHSKSNEVLSGAIPIPSPILARRSRTDHNGNGVTRK